MSRWTKEDTKFWDDMVIDVGRKTGRVHSPAANKAGYHVSFSRDRVYAAVSPKILSRLVREGRLDPNGVPL